jgi:hypothetical protein
MLIYDIEIKKAIPDKGKRPVESVEYCGGWNDHENMGVSTVCAYDYEEDRYRVFCEDNLEEFSALVDAHDVIVSFNGIGFDNPVLSYVLTTPDIATTIILERLNEKSYDIRDKGRKWSMVRPRRYDKGKRLSKRQVRQWSPGPCMVSDWTVGATY